MPSRDTRISQPLTSPFHRLSVVSSALVIKFRHIHFSFPYTTIEGGPTFRHQTFINFFVFVLAIDRVSPFLENVRVLENPHHILVFLGVVCLAVTHQVAAMQRDAVRNITKRNATFLIMFLP